MKKIRCPLATLQGASGVSRTHQASHFQRCHYWDSVPNFFSCFQHETNAVRKKNNPNITQQQQQPQLEKSNQIKIPRGRQSK